MPPINRQINIKDETSFDDFVLKVLINCGILETVVKNAAVNPNISMPITPI
jgi:hypothetical protein